MFIILKIIPIAKANYDIKRPHRARMLRGKIETKLASLENSNRLTVTARPYEDHSS